MLSNAAPPAFKGKVYLNGNYFATHDTGRDKDCLVGFVREIKEPKNIEIDRRNNTLTLSHSKVKYDEGKDQITFSFDCYDTVIDRKELTGTHSEIARRLFDELATHFKSVFK